MRVAQMTKMPKYEQKYHKVKRLFYDAQEILLIHLAPPLQRSVAAAGVKGPLLSIFLPLFLSLLWLVNEEL